MATYQEIKTKAKSEFDNILDDIELKKQDLKNETEVAKEYLLKQKKLIQEEAEALAQKSKALKNKSLIDSLQERVISRKLLVFGAATSLFMWFGLDADTWGMIAMCYIGGQSAIDFAKTWKG